MRTGKRGETGDKGRRGTVVKKRGTEEGEERETGDNGKMEKFNRRGEMRTEKRGKRETRGGGKQLTEEGK